jgi:hypothetical protein
MRLIFKIFSILFALYILSILFVSPAKAACSEDAYGNCTGTCNCASYGLCGSCSCKWQSENYCGATGCSPCPTSTPKPTNPPASPTDTPAPTPTTAGLECPPSNLEGCRDATEWCMSKKCNCKCTSSGLTNCVLDVALIAPTIAAMSPMSLHVTPGQDKGCNNWGPWSGCMSGQDACGGCASQGYTCQVRYCIHPPNSNQYQISCGCSQPPGGGSNPTNTTAPTAPPNPYWLKLKGASFRGLSSILLGLVSLPSCLRAFVVRKE